VSERATIVNRPKVIETPLQIGANLTLNALANGGDLRVPSIVDEIVAEAPKPALQDRIVEIHEAHHVADYPQAYRL
jgi:hypothetical protein